jgi:hypothetical protein
MKDTDLTLIVDLVAGLLSPAEEKDALALISSDPELLAAYASQREVSAGLADLPAPSMTAGERAHLHAELKAQLHLDDPSPVVAPTPSRWSRWMAPLGGLAVAAAVVIGAVLVLPGTLGGENDAAFNAAAPATTTAASTGSAETLEDGRLSPTASGESVGTIGEESPSAPGGVSEGGDAPIEASVAADGVGEQPSQAVASILELPFVADIDLETLAASYSSDPDVADESLSKRSSNGSPLSTDQISSCIDTASADAPDSVVSPLAVTDYDGVEAVILAITPPSGNPHLVVYSLDACTELANTDG